MYVCARTLDDHPILFPKMPSSHDLAVRRLVLLKWPVQRLSTFIGTLLCNPHLVALKTPSSVANAVEEGNAVRDEPLLPWTGQTLYLGALLVS